MSLRDLVALHSLQHQGMSLCPGARYAPRRSPLWEAVLSALSPNGTTIVTCTASEPGARQTRRGFVQLRPLRGRPAAELLYIAPAPVHDEIPSVWDQLLARVAGWVSVQGVARVFAAMPADGPEEEAFRRNGYVRYATETVYCLNSVSGAVEAPTDRLRPIRKRDVWSLQRLYVATTPLRVQQAEGLLNVGWHVLPDEWSGPAWSQCLVTEDQSGLCGELSLRRGGSVHWMRVNLRPDSSDLAGEMVDEALARVAQWPDRPLCCSVRHYQERLPFALAERGFVPVAERALTVRLTVLCVRPAIEEAILRLQGALGTGLNCVANEICDSAEGVCLAGVSTSPVSE